MCWILILLPNSEVDANKGEGWHALDPAHEVLTQECTEHNVCHAVSTWSSCYVVMWSKVQILSKQIAFVSCSRKKEQVHTYCKSSGYLNVERCHCSKAPHHIVNKHTHTTSIKKNPPDNTSSAFHSAKLVGQEFSNMRHAFTFDFFKAHFSTASSPENNLQGGSGFPLGSRIWIIAQYPSILSAFSLYNGSFYAFQDTD